MKSLYDSNYLIQSVKGHEGYRKHVYLCSAGKNTIGYGFNLDVGISEGLASHVLRYQLAEIHQQCAKEFHWFSREDFGCYRRNAIVEMVFNLGMEGFKKFKKTIAYLESGDYFLAADEALDSKWYKDVGTRAVTVTNVLRTNSWDS